jgi:hypothetical protein
MTRSLTFNLAAGRVDSAVTFGLLDMFVALVTVTFSKLTVLGAATDGELADWVPAELFCDVPLEIIPAMIIKKTILFTVL